MTKPVAVLDASKPQDVKYCIPLWLRDEQIKSALKRPIKRLGPMAEVREDPIAVVGYGPSLADTWEHVQKFAYVISCSGSHKFLVERGIIPTWHVEVDPRPHKIQLLGEPQKDTEYLVASTCHPKYFDHLKDFNVTLWHIFSAEENVHQVLPKGEWWVTGGASVGLRAMTLARYFGFVNQHIFGMDGSEGKTGKHAAFHPMQPKGYALTTYDGVEYKTTPSLLEVARQTFHELDQMPDVKAKFYGEGLVQHMSRNYTRTAPQGITAIAANPPELISADYRRQNEQLHEERLDYGVGGWKHADTVMKLVDTLKTHSVLDYGCGKGYLAKHLPFPIWEYDPAFPDKAGIPRPADIVVCTDVLEHIEPDRLGFVLADLRRCVRQVGYFTIHTGAASKTLPDGRNTHLIQKPRDWWAKRIEKFFTVGTIEQVGPELHVVVGKKGG